MSNNLFIEYPRCSTCKNAKKYLQDAGVKFSERNIVEDVPTKEELSKWYDTSGLDIKKFFNTSGIAYREMQLKDKLNDMTTDEKLELLSTNGMLIKRPLFIGDNGVIVGFKETEYSKLS